MVVGDAELLVTSDGRVLVVEALALFDGDTYDEDHEAFDIWQAASTT